LQPPLDADLTVSPPEAPPSERDPTPLSVRLVPLDVLVVVVVPVTVSVVVRVAVGMLVRVVSVPVMRAVPVPVAPPAAVLAELVLVPVAPPAPVPPELVLVSVAQVSGFHWGGGIGDKSPTRRRWYGPAGYKDSFPFIQP
jgi:hypothetical protein